MRQCLVDTNLILRSANKGDASHALALAAIAALIAQGRQPVITAQVLIEFWSAATRPVANNGFGWEPERVAAEVQDLLARFPVLADTPGILPRWLELVRSRNVRGKQVHDTRLVAVMLEHGVTDVLTFNVPDFKRFTQIHTVHPSELVQP